MLLVSFIFLIFCGPAHGRVNRSGPNFGANISFLDSDVDKKLMNDIHNWNGLDNIRSWIKNHTRASSSEVTGLPRGVTNLLNQNGHNDVGYRPHGNKHDSVYDFFVVFLVLLNILAIFCGCFPLCSYLAKERGWFTTVNRNGPAHGRVNRSVSSHGRVNRSGPSLGANRSSFGSDVFVEEEPSSVFILNNLLRTQDDPTIGSGIIDTHSWNTTHTRVHELPPGYSEATELPSGVIYLNQIGHYDVGCRPLENEHDSEKCGSGYDYKDGEICDSYDRAGTTYDSSYCGGGGGDTGGGDTGGWDSCGCEDTTTDYS